MVIFGVDQENDYLAWLKSNPNGYVLNLNTQGAGQDIVHSSRCPTLAVERYERHTTFTKVCSSRMAELMAYSRSLGHSPRLCAKC